MVCYSENLKRHALYILERKNASLVLDSIKKKDITNTENKTYYANNQKDIVSFSLVNVKIMTVKKERNKHKENYNIISKDQPKPNFGNFAIFVRK